VAAKGVRVNAIAPGAVDTPMQADPDGSPSGIKPISFGV